VRPWPGPVATTQGKRISYALANTQDRINGMHDEATRSAGQSVFALVGRTDMKSIMVRNNSAGLWHLAGHTAVLLALGALVALAGDGYLQWPAMLLLGIAITHLFAPQHECAHYSAFRTRRLNEVVAWMCGLLIMVPQIHFRYEHTDHHTYTNLPDRDPQHIPLPRSVGAYLWYLSAIPYWWSSWSGLARRSVARLTAQELGFIPPGQRRFVVWEARLMSLVYVGVAALVVAGWHAPLQYWFLPLLLGQPVMRFIRMTEHVGRPTEIDLLHNTRTTQVSWPWQFLAWNMNFHAEHHLAPPVPYHALPRLRSLLNGRVPVRDGYRAGHREIWSEMKARRDAR